MKKHKQDDDDYHPTKKTKSNPGPRSGPKTAQKPASEKTAPKTKPRSRAQTLSPGPVGASAQILIPTPKKLNRPAKKLNPQAPPLSTGPNGDAVWVIDGISDDAAGPSTLTKKGAKAGRRKHAPKKPLFGPLELDSDVTSDTPAVLKRKSLVSEMAKTAKRATVSPAKPIHPAKHPAPRGRQQKENEENKVDVVEDSYPMEQTNIGDVDTELAPPQTTKGKSTGSSRPRHTDNKENEEIEVVEDSYPTEPKQKQNMSTALTQALQHFELLSEAPLPPPKSPKKRMGARMQEQERSPKQFDPSMVDEHANRKPNLVGWNTKGPTNQGISPKKKLLRVPSATVNEQGSPIVRNDDPRLRALPREVLDLTQLPDTSEFTSDNINQSNDEDVLMAGPTQTFDPRLRLLDRLGATRAQPAESSVYTPENFDRIHDEGGVTADSVYSEDGVDLVLTQLVIPTQIALPTRAETLPNPGQVPIVPSTARSSAPIHPTHPTLKPTLLPTKSVQPLTRANMETLKSIAQDVLTSPNSIVGAKVTREVAHDTTRVVTNVAFENKPTLQQPQDPLKRRLSWLEDTPSKKVKENDAESKQSPVKPFLQQLPAHKQIDSQNAVESQTKPLPKVRRMQLADRSFHDQNDNQNGVESQPKPLPKLQRMKSAEPESHLQKDSQNGVDSQVKLLPKVQRLKSAEPTPHYQTFSEHESRMAALIKNVEASREDQTSIGGQSGPKQRASDDRSAPKPFQERPKQRFPKPAPPSLRSPIRAPIQDEVPQRQKLARRPPMSPPGEHRYAQAPRVQVPTTPPHQHTTEKDMDVTLVESDTDEEEEFEEHTESVEEDQDGEYSSSDSLLEAEEDVEYEEEAATPEHAPAMPEHQRTVSEALHKLADAMTIRFCDTETAAKVPVEQFERGAEKVISMIAEGRTNDLQGLNIRLDADRERVSARIEQMIGNIESDQPPPASKKSKRIIEERMQNTLCILDQWMESAGMEKEKEEKD